MICSVCRGPANDTSKGHYLYYFRDHLDAGADPATCLAGRIQWAARTHAARNGAPLFLLIFGGLGLYGGHDDYFLFLARVLSHLDDRFVPVGAQAMARLARQAVGVHKE